MKEKCTSMYRICDPVLRYYRVLPIQQKRKVKMDTLSNIVGAVLNMIPRTFVNNKMYIAEKSNIIRNCQLLF